MKAGMKKRPTAMSERTRRSRSSIRCERKVSWGSSAMARSAGSLLARGRGRCAWLLDAELELRRGRGDRILRYRGGGVAHVAVDGLLQLAHLALGLARLRLDLRLEGARGILELGLHLAELRELHLAMYVRLHLRDVALQPPEEVAERARDAR